MGLEHDHVANPKDGKNLPPAKPPAKVSPIAFKRNFEEPSFNSFDTLCIFIHKNYAFHAE